MNNADRRKAARIEAAIARDEANAEYTTRLEMQRRAARILKQAGFTYREVAMIFDLGIGKVTSWISPRSWERRSIRQAAGNACDICGANGKLSVHHVSYEPVVTQVLCQSCHMKVHHGSMDSLLTRRQADVARGIARGLTGKEIAAELGIAPRTVEVYKAGIKEKLGLNNAAELLRMALREFPA